MARMDVEEEKTLGAVRGWLEWVREGKSFLITD